jgi:hypothetical protein
MRREWRTVSLMISLYCRDHHSTGESPCAACRELIEYARHRLEKCPYGADKPTCDQCPIHCYSKARREQIREVMRYAGPRLLGRHPILAIWHTLDRRRPAPPLG